MQSPARFRLQMKFSELAIGQQFHLVNTVMSGAVPGSPIFEKIIGEHEGVSLGRILVANAIQLDTKAKVLIRESADVELI